VTREHLEHIYSTTPIDAKYGKKSYVVKGKEIVTREHLEHIYSTTPNDAKYGKKSYVVKGK
jgi:hypothetical protein